MLHRRNLSVLFEDEKGGSSSAFENGEILDEEEKEVKKKVMPWAQKNQQKKVKKASKKPSSGGNKKPVKKDEPAKMKTKEAVEEIEEDSAASEDDSELDESENEQPEEAEKSVNNDSSEPEKDDDQLEKLQSDVALRRQRLLEGKSQVSHSVHCPYYPLDKQEYWWAYITDRKNQLLLTAPYHVTNLVEQEEIQLKFTAPFKPGVYTFAVCLRSDSYFGFDQMKDIKVKMLKPNLTVLFFIIYLLCWLKS